MIIGDLERASEFFAGFWRLPHVPKYLNGHKRMPRQIPAGYQLGSEDEAIIYVNLYGECWKKTPGALAWLEAQK